MKARQRVKYAGADWIKFHRPDISEFGVTVADILGQAYEGIYHIQKEVLHNRVNWASDRWIEVTVFGSLASFDSDRLMVLLCLCHAQKVRLQIDAAAPKYLRLSFSKEKAWHRLMPSITEHIEAIQPLVDAIVSSEAVP